MTDSNLSKKDPGYSSDTSDLFSDDEDEYDTFTIDNDEKVSTADPSNIKSSSIDEADADENDDADSEISEAEKWPPENGEILVKVVPTTKRKIQKRFQNKYDYIMTTPRERSLVNNNEIYEYLNNKNIIALLEALGFKVTVKENLSGEDYIMTTPRERSLVNNNEIYEYLSNKNIIALLEGLGFKVTVKENPSGEDYIMTTPREGSLVNNNEIYEYLNNKNIIALLEGLGFKVTVKENPSGEYYGMTTPIRGIAMVINNNEYKDPNYIRKGSELDVKNIISLLKGLGFMVMVKENLSGEEILQALRDEKQVMSHNNYGMFSFSFFGHGGKNDIIYGIDWKPVNLAEIYHLLGPAEFPALAGKPKVLIFNACRRNRPSKRPVSESSSSADAKDLKIFQRCFENWLSSMDYKILHFDTNDIKTCRRGFEDWLLDGNRRKKSAKADPNPDPPLSTDRENFQNFENCFADWLSNTPIIPDPPLDTRDFRVLHNQVKIWQSIRNADPTPVISPNMDDFLIIRSCSEGQGSSRNPTVGSISIYTVVKTQMKHCCHRDLPTSFEIVTERVKKATNSLQTPTLDNHLRRKLMLFPGYNGK